MKKALLMFFILGLLTACGGGGGGGGGGGTVNESPDGIWTGSFTDSGVTYDFAGLVYNNYLVAFSSSAGTLYEGTVFVNGSTLSGTVDVYIGGAYSNTTVLSGTVNGGVSISGSDDVGATFTLAYDSLYDRTSSLAKVAGIWSITEGAFTQTIVVASDGTFTGSDTDGCLHNGAITILDASHNIYRVANTVSSCGIFNGSYLGYATLDDFAGTNDAIIVSQSNASWVSLGALIKQ